MFDKLVESTKQKPQGRNRFYLMTSLLYGVALSAAAVLTIIWFNPGLAEANTDRLVFTPPPIVAPPPPAAFVQSKPMPIIGFVPPRTPSPNIPDARTVPPRPPASSSRIQFAGVPNISDINVTGPGFPSNAIGDTTEPPPPTPTPAPTPKATPTPAPTPKTPDIVRLTSEMVTGKAIRKVQPPYPQIAKAVRAQGTVPVQITISEEGRVLQATVMGGNPTLHDAARQAALQWVFSPTVLNGKPVKVSGVISFNFILN